MPAEQTPEPFAAADADGVGHEPAEVSPKPPGEEIPIEFWTIGASATSAGKKRPHKGELPPPVSGGRDWPKAAKPGGVSDFWALVGCNAIVFGASVCIMVIELTASRLIAAYLGNSLYTWTSVIGVVLAGISIGNYLGGWLADRFPPQKVLAWLFLSAGLLTFSVLLLNNWAAETRRPDGINWQLWVMLVVAWVFFLPALALGTISPVTASMALKRSMKTGITVGNIYAWGALGSIVGTFLAGFWLIGEFGTKQVIWTTSSVLVIMGALVAAGQRAFRAAAILGALPLIVQFGLYSSMTEERMSEICRSIAGIRSWWATRDEDFLADSEATHDATEKKDEAALIAARDRATWRQERRQAESDWAAWGKKLGKQMHQMGLTLALRKDSPNEYNDESDYYAINIAYGTSDDGDSIKQLRLDHLIHSYYNPDNPTKLYYDYERVYAAVTERAAALWNRHSEVQLPAIPDEKEFLEALPPSMKYDPSTKMLSVGGAMGTGHLRRLLSVGPYADYWQALLTTWESSTRDWSNATRGNSGLLQTPLEELPEGVVFSENLGPRVHYDALLRSILCTGPFDVYDFFSLVGQGEMRPYVEAVRDLYFRSRRTSTMFIGGGGFVFPRWIEAGFPDEPLIDVAEIDPAVKAAIESELGLKTEYGNPRDDKTYVRTHIGDARKFVDERLRENEKRRAAGQPAVMYDFVYGDAFNDLSVPWHLTTREFSDKIHRLLTPGIGVYLVNIIDIYPRTEYPPRSEKTGVAVASFTGPLPQMLAPEKPLAEEYVSCRGPFKHLEVARVKEEYRLRYMSVMSKETRDALSKLNVPAEGDEEEPPARKGRRKPNAQSFADAVSELHRKSNARKFLSDPLPEALLPLEVESGTWQAAPEPFGSIRVYHGSDGYLLGFRGVMQDATRQSLLDVAAGNAKFKQAVDDIFRRSRQEEVGRFLGRYVSTARKVFPYVYLFTSNEGDPGASRDTFVVACSLAKLNFENLEYNGGHWKHGPFAWTESAADGQPGDFGEMPAILELARGKDLTDDFAPVDNMLAPVFANRSQHDD